MKSQVRAQTEANTKKPIASIEIRTTYGIKGFDELLKNGKIEIPVSLGATLLSVFFLQRMEPLQQN